MRLRNRFLVVLLALVVGASIALSASPTHNPRIVCEPCPGFALCEIDPEPENGTDFLWHVGTGMWIEGPTYFPYVKVVCGASSTGGITVLYDEDGITYSLGGIVRCGGEDW